MNKKTRLDLHLLTKGLAPSREQARKLIRAGKVRDCAGNILDKPGHEVSRELEIHVKRSPRYVSRGGQKLEAAIDNFPIQVAGRVCLDAGISTGGFTDCLLQKGASLVYGIDVGYGQTAWSLRNDPKVVLMERTNIRHLTSDELYNPKDSWATLAVADLSFISLKLVLPAIKSLLAPQDKEALLLIKPQFEVGRSRVGKGGVVKEASAHIDSIESIVSFSKKEGWISKGLVGSPITGPAGNHEYILWLGIQGIDDMPNIKYLVEKTLGLKS